MSLYAFEQQAATRGPDRAARAPSDLQQTIRQITADVQAATQDAQIAGQEARQAAIAGKAASTDAAAHARVVIGEHGIIINPQMPTAPVIAEPRTIYVPGGMDNVIPPQAVDLAFGFFIMCAVMVIGWPLARAFGRRIERRGTTAAVDSALSGQLQRIEQAVDAMSIEIERISESQRFMAKLQNGGADRGALSSVERR
jgi:hypothetical protein